MPRQPIANRGPLRPDTCSDSLRFRRRRPPLSSWCTLGRRVSSQVPYVPTATQAARPYRAALIVNDRVKPWRSDPFGGPERLATRIRPRPGRKSAWERWCPGREPYATTDTTNRCLSLVWWRECLARWRRFATSRNSLSRPVLLLGSLARWKASLCPAGSRQLPEPLAS